jgi:hypothetical protein
MPAIEELAALLHQLVRANGLGRPDVQRRPPVTGLIRGPQSLPDATVEHPLYGGLLAEWLESHQPEPHRALLGLLRSGLNELRAAISRKGDKFQAPGPTD